ncbi:MAG: hypothetical protein AAF337_04155 [Pseudomonadota bacterium]
MKNEKHRAGLLTAERINYRLFATIPFIFLAFFVAVNSGLANQPMVVLPILMASIFTGSNLIVFVFWPVRCEHCGTPLITFKNYFRFRLDLNGVNKLSHWKCSGCGAPYP